MNKMLILLLCLLSACNVSKKMSSQTTGHKEEFTTREIFSRQYLDSLFRSHIKLSVTYTKENFLPIAIPVSDPGTTIPIPVGKQSVPPVPAIREQITINLETDTETHVQKKDSLSDTCATQITEDQSQNTLQTKERSLSWKGLLWLSLLLVLVAITLYCVKNKINPFVKLLKLLQKWL